MEVFLIQFLRARQVKGQGDQQKGVWAHARALKKVMVMRPGPGELVAERVGYKDDIDNIERHE